MAILHVKTPNGVTKAYDLDRLGGIPVGFEYFSMNPNVPQGSLPLLGGEYNRATYPDLWAWVQTQTGYCKTESEWQELSAAQNGNVPFYSSGNGSTTFRVPSLKCWVKSANGVITEVGSYLEAGLPNIMGETNTNFAVTTTSTSDNFGAGAFDAPVSDITWARTNGDCRSVDLKINASLYNSIYGNSSTVQPESIVGLWLVKAYGTIVDTGSIDEQQYIDDRIAALPSNQGLLNTFLPLSGGTITGDIEFGSGRKIYMTGSDVNPDMDLYIRTLLLESKATNGGARLILSGKQSEATGNYIGNFSISSFDGINPEKKLIGNSDGTLTWNEYDVLTKANAVPIENGGTGATTRLNAAKNLLNENVGASATYFLTMTSGFANMGYSTVANAKKVLGIDVIGAIVTKETTSDISLAASTGKNITSISLPGGGVWVIRGSARFDNLTANHIYGINIGTTSNAYSYNGDSAIAMHSSSGAVLRLLTVSIFTTTSATTFYLTGYSTAASKVVSGADLTAVRII